MAYFSNGTEGMEYEARWCSSCVYSKGYAQTGGCPVWLAHLLYNYEECNNPKSVLHLLIPRSKDGLGNLKCTMHLTREDLKRIRREKTENTLPLFSPVDGNRNHSLEGTARGDTPAAGGKA